MSLANLIKPPTGPLTPGVWKRRGSEEDEDDHDSSRVKKPRYSWYVTLEDESPGPIDEDSNNESIYSVQDEETEYARDTSDTSTSAWINPNDHRNMTIDVEYEVASTSESENPFLDSSSSDPDDLLTVNVLASVSESDLDLDRVEDTDASLTSMDSEIGKADYWTCIQCNTTNNNPLFRYCERCYQLRKNLFPPRPKRKKRHQKLTSNAEAESSQNSGVLSREDSGLGSSQASQSLLTDIDTEIFSQPETLPAQVAMVNTKIGNTIIETTIGIDSDHMNHGDKKTDNDRGEDFIKKMELIQEKIKSDDEIENKYCLVCTVNPKNGAFVHGNVSHICCCYRCAVKVWKTTRHCPICKRKVTNVLKAFYV